MKHSGRIQFCRFQVTGDAPESPLASIYEHRFQECEIGTYDEVEVGFVTGLHMLDTDFTTAKNCVGDKLLFAVRIDTHKVPSEVKKAYRKMVEHAMAKSNPSGFLSKVQKEEAKTITAQQIQNELATGKYRRTKLVPVMWDIAQSTVYVAGTSNTMHESVARIFRQAFGVELTYLSAGQLAGRIARKMKKAYEFEDLLPSLLTPHPTSFPPGVEINEQTPSVPWVLGSHDTKDFIGNEFLIWLWHKVETNEGEAGGYYFACDKLLDMQCAWGVNGSQALRGNDPLRQVEAGDALATGKWPRKIHLILADGDHQFEFTLQGDRWVVSAAQLPDVSEAQTPSELLEARCNLMVDLAKSIDTLFALFMDERMSPVWEGRVNDIRDWVSNRVG